MNDADVNRLVQKALKHNYGLWVDTDYGQLDLFGDDLAETWDNLAPGESFVVLGVVTADTRKEI